MKRVPYIASMLFLSSCQWIATHPKEDVEILYSAEEVVRDLYQYETRTLSPAPPMPPFKINPTMAP